MVTIRRGPVLLGLNQLHFPRVIVEFVNFVRNGMRELAGQNAARVTELQLHRSTFIFIVDLRAGNS
jgi:hypothetical protein